MFLNKTFQIPKYLNAGSPLRARVSIRPYKFNTSDVIRLTLTWGFRLLHLSTSNRLSSLFRVHLLHFTSDSHQSHLPLILRGHIFLNELFSGTQTLASRWAASSSSEATGRWTATRPPSRASATPSSRLTPTRMSVSCWDFHWLATIFS